MYIDIKTKKAMIPILGYENYGVSMDGIVGKHIGQCINEPEYDNYEYITPVIKGEKAVVTLQSTDGSSKEFFVDKLVADARYGPLPFKVIHRDYEESNNKGKNLFFLTKDHKILDSITINGEEIQGPVMVVYDNQKNAVVLKPLPDQVFKNNYKYWISRKGSVYDATKKVFCASHMNYGGYLQIGLYYTGTDRMGTSVQRLVYAAWVDPDIEGWTIDHLNSNTIDNDYKNLEKVTNRENVRRAYQRQGEEYKKRFRVHKEKVERDEPYRTPQKYDLDTVRKICEDFVSGMTPKEVAAKYPEVTKGTIFNIKLGKQYRNVGETVPGMFEVYDSRIRNYNYSKPKAPFNFLNLSKEKVETICKMLEDRKSTEEIMEYMHVSNPHEESSYVKAVKNLIYCIIEGKAYQNIASNYNIPTKEERKNLGLHLSNAGQFTKGFTPWNKASTNSRYIKYPVDDIIGACKMMVEGKSIKEISNVYPNILRDDLNHIRTGDKYRGISESVPGMDEVFKTRTKKRVNVSGFKFTKDDIHKVCKMLEDLKSTEEICKEYNCDTDAKVKSISQFITRIMSGRQHPEISSQYNLPTSKQREELGLNLPNKGQFKNNDPRFLQRGKS